MSQPELAIVARVPLAVRRLRWSWLRRLLA